MADYFTRFSIVIPLKDSSQQPYALDLASRVARQRWEDTPDSAPADVPAEFIPVLEDWWFEVEKQEDCGIWLHSDSGGI
ncbi:MAG: hypothetical protein ACREIC_19700, partial [Limisphaerales bacterium]